LTGKCWIYQPSSIFKLRYSMTIVGCQPLRVNTHYKAEEHFVYYMLHLSDALHCMLCALWVQTTCSAPYGQVCFWPTGCPFRQEWRNTNNTSSLGIPTFFIAGSSLNFFGNYSWSNWSLRMNAIYSFRTLGTTHLISQHPIQDDWNHQRLLS